MKPTRHPLVWALVATVSLGLPAQAADRLSPEAEGAALALELRTQRPSEPLVSSGIMRLRDGDGRWISALPVRLEVRLHADSWETIYTAGDAKAGNRETLTVTRSDGQPNRYLLERAGDVTAPSSRATLTDGQATIPFAASEFWLTDLGMEFLHWPQQRVIKTEMRKGRSCKVLESINPNPTGQSYARVLAWIDLEHRGLLRAEAYDAERRLVKEFSIGGFKKVNGRWELKSMEIRNGQSDARTRLEFEFEIE